MSISRDALDSAVFLARGTQLAILNLSPPLPTEKKMKTLAISLLLGVMLCVTNAAATVMPIGEGAFPGSALLVDFSGLADGTEVNGLVVDGVGFSYSLGNGQVDIDGGPGNTNNIEPPNIVSIGDNTGSLTIALPAPANMFGYGFD